MTGQPMMTPQDTPQPRTRLVMIPGSDDHDGWYSILLHNVPWVCPVRGGPRGDIQKAISFDGSKRLAYDGWTNPCGHVDTYAAVRAAHPAPPNPAQNAEPGLAGKMFGAAGVSRQSQPGRGRTAVTPTTNNQ